MLNCAKQSRISTNYDLRNNENIDLRRARIPIKCIYRNQSLSNKLSAYLLKIEGISYVKANPLTSRILIIYNYEIINQDEIKKCLYDYSKKLRSINPKDNITKIKKLNFNEENAVPLSEFYSNNYSDSNVNFDHKNIWHFTNSEKIQKILKTNYKYGISKTEAQKRIKEIGLNVLSSKKKESLMKKIISSFNNASTKLLLGISGISFFLGQIVDAMALLGIVAVESIFSVAQHYKAENSISSLKKIMVNKALVIRDGEYQKIDAKKIVPGDVILIESGDRVPADARIIESNELRTNESSLTGESTAVMKNNNVCGKYAELAERNNMIYMGTDVVGGKGRAVVVATRKETEIGKIALMLEQIKNEMTPLQHRMLNFTTKLSKIAFVVSIFAVGAGLLIGRSLGQVLTLAVSFSVGALPESLPAVVTIAMAASVQRLSQKNVIVRKINAVETLGCANVICCDKTGTLTMNEMTVKEIYMYGSLYNITGIGYNPSGKVNLIEGEPNKEKELNKLFTCGALCSNGKISIGNKGNWIVNGDPTEGAIVTAGRKIGINEETLRKRYKRIKEIPFDSNRRYMTVLVEDKDKYIAYCKGSFSKIINKCSTIYENGKVRLFTNTDKEKMEKIKADMTDNALRLLAFGYKTIDKEDGNIDSNFTFLGFLGMEDPARHGVKESIERCHKASINVVMITGDNKNTASAIGRQLGLLNEGLVVSGAELEKMTDEELNSKIRNIQVFARTSPDQKLRIVNAFKRAGYVVAMTGDGVNDAPAIKEADIGIAMGKNGSDVARDTADIVLVDDKFSTIVTAILEGRTTTSNIKHTMKYLLAGSLGEIIAIGASILSAKLLPLLSIQILWINIICETIMGSTIALEPPSDEIMVKMPDKKEAPLIETNIRNDILRRSFRIGLTSFGVFELYAILGANIGKARTMAFSNLICSQIINAYGCRGNKKLLPHKYMNAASSSSILVLAAIVNIPFLNYIFGTVPLTIKDCLILSAASGLSKS